MRAAGHVLNEMGGIELARMAFLAGQTSYLERMPVGAYHDRVAVSSNHFQNLEIAWCHSPGIGGRMVQDSGES